MAKLGAILAVPSTGLGAATTASCIFWIKAPTNQRLAVRSIEMMISGSSTGDVPTTFQLCRYSSAGTMTTATPSHACSTAVETLQSTAAIQGGPGLNPAIIEQVGSGAINPNGSYRKEWPRGDEYTVGGGERWGLTVVSGGGGQILATVEYEE